MNLIRVSYIVPKNKEGTKEKNMLNIIKISYK